VMDAQTLWHAGLFCLAMGMMYLAFFSDSL
jgi:hypothetical protein